MRAFPMFIKTTGRRVVVVGGGEQAAQKARLILKTDAEIVLAALSLDDELAALVVAGRAAHHDGPITAELFAGAAMVFIGSGCPGIDAAIHAIAKAAGVAVNVVDQPDLCDMTTPALVDRDPVVVAIGTEGTAPVLARQIKTKLEQDLEQNLGGLAAMAGRLRGAVAARVPRDRRRGLWAWVFGGALRQTWATGQESDAADSLKAAISAGGPPIEDDAGSIALVGAGPGARDLLTLRAVQRLQEADVIFYDRLVDEEVLELARRDAERVFVGKHLGAHAWPQDRINARIVAEAKQGRRVVRLKSGDPSVFGRAGEELAAAHAAGVAIEIVPGVTAACAASAAMGQTLTERGVASRLVLSTATNQKGQFSPDGTQLMCPGTTAVFYMGVRQARQIEDALLAEGVPPEAPVSIAVNVSKPDELLFETALEGLAARVEAEAIPSVAVLMVTWPASEKVTSVKIARA
ncbi:MAG: siroheme synthase CysG [Pseudomonadota bacterium]